MAFGGRKWHEMAGARHALPGIDCILIYFAPRLTLFGISTGLSPRRQNANLHREAAYAVVALPRATIRALIKSIYSSLKVMPQTSK